MPYKLAYAGNDHTAYRLLLMGPLLLSKATLLTSYLSHWVVINEL